MRSDVKVVDFLQWKASVIVVYETWESVDVISLGDSAPVDAFDISTSVIPEGYLWIIF